METPATADPRADLFIQNFKSSFYSGLSFTDKDNAFYPYRHKHFVSGLSPLKQTQLAALQEAGHCGDELGNLLVEGILNLYPFLQPAFDDPARARKLKLLVITHPLNMGPDGCADAIYGDLFATRAN